MMSNAKSRDTRAQAGEFTNLCEFIPDINLPTQELEPMIEKGELKFRNKKVKRSIDSFSTWLSAWNNYELVLMAKHPNIYKKLVAYRDLIQNCDKNFKWNAVMKYDMRFRAKRGESNNFDFDIVDTTLYATIFDATAVKSTWKTCLRCNASDHLVADCPFPEEHQVAENASKYRKKTHDTTVRWFNNGIEGCNNYQLEHSCSYPGCRRAHVCRSCRGPDPYARCITCNS